MDSETKITVKIPWGIEVIIITMLTLALIIATVIFVLKGNYHEFAKVGVCAILFIISLWTLFLAPKNININIDCLNIQKNTWKKIYTLVRYRGY